MRSVTVDICATRVIIKDITEYYKHLSLFWTDHHSFDVKQATSIDIHRSNEGICSKFKKISTELIEINEDLLEFNQHLTEYYKQLAEVWE